MRSSIAAASLGLLAAAGCLGDRVEDIVSSSQELCVATCDGENPKDDAEDWVRETRTVNGRRVALHVSLADQAGWASIDNGTAGDQTWIERRYGGATPVQLGRTTTPAGWTGWRTTMQVMGGPSDSGPEIRACGAAASALGTVVCTGWYSGRVCFGGLCDGANASLAKGDRTLQTVTSNSRRISIHVSPGDAMAWAQIEGGSAGDRVWLDRSRSQGVRWAGLLGAGAIATGNSSRRTPLYVTGYVADPRMQVRACGNAANGPVSCTEWFPIVSTSYPDGTDPAVFTTNVKTTEARTWFRKVVVHASTSERMAWASIDSGAAGDRVWLDRSWNGGASWQPLLGDTKISAGSTGIRTWAFSYYDKYTQKSALVRACGQALGTGEIACTLWYPFPNEQTDTIHRLAANDLSNRLSDVFAANPATFYGWGEARALHALIDYTGLTGDCRHWNRVIEVNVTQSQARLLENNFYDDVGWWGMAWVRAAEVAPRCGDSTNVATYLNRARGVWEYISQHGWMQNLGNVENVENIKDVDQLLRGGGVRQRRCADSEAISNSTFMAVSAGLARNLAGTATGTVYRNWANRVAGFEFDDNGTKRFPWFENFSNQVTWSHRRLSSQGLIMDNVGIRAMEQSECERKDPNQEPPNSTAQPYAYDFNHSDALDNCGHYSDLQRSFPQACIYDGDGKAHVFSYNQGVPINAYSQMALLKDRDAYLARAEAYAQASIKENAFVTKDKSRVGEPLVISEGGKLSDGAYFKGAFVQGLRVLVDVQRQFARPTANYELFLKNQRDAVLANARAPGVGDATFRDSWLGGTTWVGLGTQTSAVNAFNAAYGL